MFRTSVEDVVIIAVGSMRMARVSFCSRREFKKKLCTETWTLAAGVFNVCDDKSFVANELGNHSIYVRDI